MHIHELPEALAELAARITAAGLPATTDPTTITVPGAWVTLDSMADQSLCGDFATTAQIIVIARDTGTTPALRSLADNADTVAAVVPGIQTVRPESLGIPGHAAPLPCLTMTAPID